MYMVLLNNDNDIKKKTKSQYTNSYSHFYMLFSSS